MKALVNILYSFFGGLIAGIISLIISTLFITDHKISILHSGIISGVFVEEMIKLMAILCLSYLINPPKLTKATFLNQKIIIAVFFGLGFSIFEIILISINPIINFGYNFIFNILIHIGTSFLLFLSVSTYHNKKKLSTRSLAYLILAFFIHLCYNLIVDILS